MTALPPLPVPSLEETAATLRRSLEPFVQQNADPSARGDVDECIQELATGAGGAHALQDALLRRQRECHAAGTSWLSAWWLEYAYLSTREPLPPKEGSTVALPPTVAGSGQAGVAAALVRAHLWEIGRAHV